MSHIFEEYFVHSEDCSSNQACIHQTFPKSTPYSEIELKSNQFFQVLGFSLFEILILFKNTRYEIKLNQGEKVIRSWKNSSLVVNIHAFTTLISNIFNETSDYRPFSQIQAQRNDFNLNPHKLNIVSDFVKAVLMYNNGIQPDEKLEILDEKAIKFFLESFCSIFKVYIHYFPDDLVFAPDVYELRPIIYLMFEDGKWRILQHANFEMASDFEYFSGNVSGLVYQPDGIMVEDDKDEENMVREIIGLAQKMNINDCKMTFKDLVIEFPYLRNIEKFRNI